MDKSPPVALPETAAAATEVAAWFRSLVDNEDISAIKQMQHLMLAATYPDASPDGAMAKTMDQRTDLENPLD
ncbi:hypothetical protein E2562_018283 [Oryza meyeriana var. granulata]|uniref:Uncharacterized protein n=1 Tax=Oryza meyeriana var. granulata TaxID=110450 RepID=A0A6G1CS17_9ORYZ|nr:hypothetical protein E2562_018283 [Oryza meyeriana var. granulata]